jgi:hypothetical protein
MVNLFLKERPVQNRFKGVNPQNEAVAQLPQTNWLGRLPASGTCTHVPEQRESTETTAWTAISRTHQLLQTHEKLSATKR